MSAQTRVTITTATVMNSVGPGGPTLSLKRRRPAAAPQANGVVFFLHPGYPDSKNVLLSLPALDSGGIHHETARIACAILADCNWNGFFSLTRDGPRLPAGPDDILTQNRYYFRIEGGMSLLLMSLSLQLGLLMSDYLR